MGLVSHPLAMSCWLEVVSGSTHSKGRELHKGMTHWGATLGFAQHTFPQHSSEFAYRTVVCVVSFPFPVPAVTFLFST